MADCARWKAGLEKKSPPVVLAKESTGMFTVLVWNVVEVQQIETLSYDTGEKASCSLLKLKVRAVHSMKSVVKFMYQPQAVPVRNQLKLTRRAGRHAIQAILISGFPNQYGVRQEKNKF